MKILILSDLHIGVSQESTTNPGKFRQANTQAFERLEALIPQFNSDNYELVVNLSDFLSEVKASHEGNSQKREEMDHKHINEVLALLTQIKHPMLNLPGNHDLSSLGLEEFTALMNKYKLDSRFKG